MFVVLFVAALKREGEKRKGEIPYTLLTVIAILLVLGAVFYFGFSNYGAGGGFFGFGGGSKANASLAPSSAPAASQTAPAASATLALASPSPIPSPSPSALPCPSPEPSLAPWPSIAGAACAGDEVCLSEKPFYCSRGRKISYCTKCGCPSGFVCGKGTPTSACDCVLAGLAVANCSMMGAGGNITVITPSPVPSPSPSPAPCNSSHYASRYGAAASNASALPSDDAFLANLSAAYAAVYGKNVSWTRAAPYWVWSDSAGGARTEIFVSKGFYRGWLPSDVVASVVANQSRCAKTTAILASSGSAAPFQVDFKQNCWNWTFLVDAKTTELFEVGFWNRSRGYWLATRFADVCPP